MSSTLGIVLFVVAILVTILIHESAHFGFAKAFGIKVEEFFVGFGPRLWSVRRGETEYGFKAIPAGGYVRIAGMNPYQEVSPEEYPRTFGAKPAWQRAVVIVAGPATHFVIAFMCFALWLGVYGKPVDRGTELAVVQKTLGGQPSPAAVAGLRPGDRVIRVDDIDHPTTDQMARYTYRHAGTPMTLTVVRNGRTFTLTITPVPATVNGKRVGRIGVVTQPAEVLRDRSSPIAAITGGWRYVGDTTVQVGKSLGRVFGPEGISRVWHLLSTNAPRNASDPTSVVGGARIAGEAVQAGAGDALLYLIAVFNVFVGLLNLIPLPPFDGGHVAVIIAEKIRRRKVDVRRLVPLTAAVAMFFILFVGSLVFLDIVKPVPNMFR